MEKNEIPQEAFDRPAAPLVSIITPCYNAADTIADTIKSVQSQTWQNWEMLIVDDCSTDGSYKIISEAADDDKRIRALSTPKASGSPAAPRNMALQAARGRYVAFLDADDMWLPEKLDRQIRFMERHGYIFTYSDYEKMSVSGKRTGRRIRLRKSTSFWDILESNSVPCLSAVLRRDIIGKIRFRNVPQEDLVFWLEIMRRRNVVAYNIGEVLAVYRESRHSRSSNKLNMIRKQWYVLRRVEKVKRIPSLYFMAAYLLKGTIKYMK